MNQTLGIVPFTKAVKALVIANVAIWFVTMVAQNYVFHDAAIFSLFALVPARVINEFWIWQLFTYMFLHSGVSHILFNMLTLWFFGAELEMRWGTRFFTLYYFVCGVGTAVIYLVGMLIYYLVTGQVMGLAAPLVGASGAIFGLMMAYAILFGDRVILFMLLFPMKARYLVMIMGAVELMTMIDSNQGSSVSNLAHLGGLAVGYLYLSYIRRRNTRAAAGGTKRGRRLKLVVNNENTRDRDTGDSQGPRYWN